MLSLNIIFKLKVPQNKDFLELTLISSLLYGNSKSNKNGDLNIKIDK